MEWRRTLFKIPGVIRFRLKSRLQGLTWKTTLRYYAIQFPSYLGVIILLIFLRWLTNLPIWSIWTLTIIWVLKDIIIFPFVWKAYDTHSPKLANKLIGGEGIAKERLAPSGYVQVNGELWKAVTKEGLPPIAKNETVKICGVSGMMLIVEGAKE